MRLLFQFLAQILAQRRRFLFSFLHVWTWICVWTEVSIHTPLLAQSIFNDTSGRIAVSTTGVIRLRATSGEIRNTNANLTALANAGTIELLGTQIRFTGASPDRVFGGSVARRIGGLVRWAADGGGGGGTQAPSLLVPQAVQGLAYSNLALVGAAPKILLDSVRVGGDAAQSSSEALFYQGSGGYFVRGGTRTYRGTFIYDNAQQQALLGGEDYLHLELQRGLPPTQTSRFPASAKRVLAGTTVAIRGNLRQRGITPDTTLANRSGMMIEGTVRVAGKTDFAAGGGEVAIGAEIGNTQTSGTQTISAEAARRIITRAESGLQLGADTAVIAVERLVVYAGTLETATSGTSVVIVASTATVRLASVELGMTPPEIAPVIATSGVLVLRAGHRLIVTGSLRNDSPSLINARFDATSLVHYNASAPSVSSITPTTIVPPPIQTIMTTAETAPYGALRLSGGTKIIDTEVIGIVGADTTGNTINPPPVRTIAVAGSFAAEGARLFLYSPQRRANGSNDSLTLLGGELVMLTPSAEAVFRRTGERGNDVEGEVQGRMRRILNQTTRDYTFTNAQTLVRFTDGVPPPAMTLDTRSGDIFNVFGSNAANGTSINPANYQPANYQPTSDVRRSVRWSWLPQQRAGDRLWTATIRVGYTAQEVLPPFSASAEARLSFYESTEQAALPSALPAASSSALEPVRVLGARLLTRQRVGVLADSLLGRVEISNLGWLEGSGLQPFVEVSGSGGNSGGNSGSMATSTQFVSGRELLLRGAAPLVRSVQAGRWSNPATWNVGREPDSTDAVEIDHVVHVGFRRLSLDGASAGGQRREQALARLAGVVGNASGTSQIAPYSALASSIRLRSNGALLVGFVGADSAASSGNSGTGFADEISPLAAWWLASSQVTVESRLESTDAFLSNMTRQGLLGQGLMGAVEGARLNASTNYRGLLLFQPARWNEGAVRLPNLMNRGSIFNGAKLEIRD